MKIIVLLVFNYETTRFLKVLEKPPFNENRTKILSLRSSPDNSNEKRKEGMKHIYLFRCKHQKIVNTYMNPIIASKMDRERAHTARRVSALEINYATT